MIQLGIRSPRKKSDSESGSDSHCCQKSDSAQKPPTPYDSESVTLLGTAAIFAKALKRGPSMT